MQQKAFNEKFPLTIHITFLPEIDPLCIREQKYNTNRWIDI